jgi:hypothetical protein
MHSDVVDLATRVRRAFERDGFLLESFAEFPKGSCGDASEMLGQVLRDAGLGLWYFHNTWFQDQSHGWIEQDGLIVDITADQFDTVDETVIVTRDRSWHGPRQPDRQLAGMYWWYDHDLRIAAHSDYKLITARVLTR